MMLATTISRATGFARNVLIVLLIGGTSAAVGGQAFGVANELPTQVYGLIAGGLLGAVLVPDIVRASRAGDHGDINRLITFSVCASLVLTVALTVAAPALVRLFAFGWPEEWLTLATSMAYWCIPQVFFFVVYTVLGQVLNAHRIYGPFAWAPVVSNVVAVAGLGVFALAFPSTNTAPDAWTTPMVIVLCGAATLGVAVQSAILVLYLRRLPFRIRWQFGMRGMGGSGRTAALAFGGVVAGQLAFLVVSNVANGAGAELHAAGIDGASLNSLNNAYLVALLPHGVFAVALTTALFTQMSHHVEEGRRDLVIEDTRSSLRQLAFVSGLFTAILVGCGTLVGAVLWNSSVIGDVLTLLAIGMTGFSQMYALNRVSLALRSGASVLVAQVVVAVITAGAAVVGLFVRADVAVPTIAVGISVANLVGFLVSASLLIRTLRRRGESVRITELLRPLWPSAVGTVVAGGGALLVRTALIAVPTGWWERAGLLVVSASVVAVVYLAVTRICGDRTMQSSAAALFQRGRR